MKNVQLYISGLAMQSMLVSEFNKASNGDLVLTLGDGRIRKFEMRGRSWIAKVSEKLQPTLGEVVPTNVSHVSVSTDTDEVFSSDSVSGSYQSSESQFEFDVAMPAKSRELIVWHKLAPLVITTSAKPAADQTGIVEPKNPAPSLSADASADVRESRVAFTKRTGQAVSFAAVVAEARADYGKVAPQLIGLKEADFVGQRLFSLGIEATAEQITAALK